MSQIIKKLRFLGCVFATRFRVRRPSNINLEQEDIDRQTQEKCLEARFSSSAREKKEAKLTLFGALFLFFCLSLTLGRSGFALPTDSSSLYKLETSGKWHLLAFSPKIVWDEEKKNKEKRDYSSDKRKKWRELSGPISRIFRRKLTSDLVAWMISAFLFS